MQTNKNSTPVAAAIVMGSILVALGALILIGLFTFAIPCTRLLDNGMVTRCFSLALMQRGVAIVVIAIGILMIVFAKSGDWIKGLAFVALLLGIVFILGSVVVTDTCNVRAHTLAIGETPAGDNRQVHQNRLDTDENIYVAWTNFDCNVGLFLPFVAWMGVAIVMWAAIFAFFVNKAQLVVKIKLPGMGIAFVALGALTMIGLGTFAQPCLDFAGTTLMPMFMRCYDVAMFIHGIAAITIIAGVLMIIYGGSKCFQMGLNVSIALLGVLAVVIPFITEACASPTMICNTGPFTAFMVVMGALILAAALVNLFILVRKGSDDDEAEA